MGSGRKCSAGACPPQGSGWGVAESTVPIRCTKSQLRLFIPWCAGATGMSDCYESMSRTTIRDSPATHFVIPAKAGIQKGWGRVRRPDDGTNRPVPQFSSSYPLMRPSQGHGDSGEGRNQEGHGWGGPWHAAQSGRMLNVESEQANNTRQAYTQRIEELHNEAALDGIEVSRTSERDFWSFVRLGDPDRRAGVVLLDNGNFRAVWEAHDASHVGIQFLGDGRAEYVIFSRRPATTEISRVTGIDTLHGNRA